MEFTQELLEKAKKAESAEALQALAKENGYEMSEDEAEAYFAQMHKTGELSDEELENVSGGGCRKNGHLVVNAWYFCDLWRCKKDKSDLYNPKRDKFYEYYGGFEESMCPVCKNTTNNCHNCDHCRYEKGLWLCYNPRK